MESGESGDEAVHNIREMENIGAERWEDRAQEHRRRLFISLKQEKKSTLLKLEGETRCSHTTGPAEDPDFLRDVGARSPT